MIRHLVLVSVVLCLFSTSLQSTAAQEAHHPRIAIVHQGISPLKRDIRQLLDLFTTEENHWENWDQVIDLFAFGLDYERPIRVDILSGLTPAPLMIYGPYTDPVTDLLEDNLEGAEYIPKKVAEDLYELLPPERGWFRILRNVRYAIMTLSTKQDHSLLKQIILKAADPTPVIKEVLGDAVIGVQLKNSAFTEDDQDKRKASFAEIRAERMGTLEKRPRESKTEFELRKGIASVQLDELERLMVESTEAVLRAAIKGSKGRVDFSGEGIDETSLAASIGMFGASQDAFASIAKAKDSALSLRINHPIDELRKASADSIIGLVRTDLMAKTTAADSKLDDGQQKAVESLIDGLIAVINGGIETGNFNAFMESVPVGDKFKTWGAIACPNARSLDEVLALIPKTGEGNKANLAMETVGSVTIHQIQLRAGFLKAADSLFGEEAELYVGTAEDVVWMAAGPDALAAMKKRSNQSVSRQILIPRFMQSWNCCRGRNEPALSPTILRNPKSLMTNSLCVN